MSEWIDGHDALMAKLAMLAKQVPDAAEQALRVEAELIKTDSMKRTPVDTGALRGSHEVFVKNEDGKIEATIKVGGPSAPYAWYVHEITWVHHPVGEAKFLQHAIEAALPGLDKRVAQRIKKALGG